MSQKAVKGFTLIELIIVTVVLSIISAFALPRFVDLRQSARTYVIKKVAGVMRSTSAIVRAQAKVEGVESGSLSVDGYSFEVASGYIRGHWNRSWRYALDVGVVIDYTSANAECTVNDLCGVGNQRNATGLPFSTGGTRGLVLIWPKGYYISDLCYAYYFNPDTGAEPIIGSVTSGC